MRKGIKIYLRIVLFGLVSCSSGKQENDFLIDSTKVGNIKLCDKISEVIKNYPHTETMNFEGDEGVTWKGQKIILPNNEWIIIEASWVDSNRIWRISTNSTKYTTVNGYKVGDKISKIKKNKDKITYYESVIGFELQSDKLNFGFELQENYADSFYREIDKCNHCLDYINLIDNEARIQNIIIAGECK
jgi:hypothetical protein